MPACRPAARLPLIATGAAGGGVHVLELGQLLPPLPCLGRRRRLVPVARPRAAAANPGADADRRAPLVGGDVEAKREGAGVVVGVLLGRRAAAGRAPAPAPCGLGRLERRVLLLLRGVRGRRRRPARVRHDGVVPRAGRQAERRRRRRAAAVVVVVVLVPGSRRPRAPDVGHRRRRRGVQEPRLRRRGRGRRRRQGLRRRRHVHDGQGRGHRRRRRRRCGRLLGRRPRHLQKWKASVMRENGTI